MNKVFIILLPLVVMFSCKCNSNTVTPEQNQEIVTEEEETVPEVVINEDAIELTTFSIDKENHDFGDITDNDPVETIFTIRNTGSNPLFILDAKASCICTTTEYNKESIAPGAYSNIKVIFDPSGKSGVQKKSVTIKTNTLHSNKVVSFSANVITN